MFASPTKAILSDYCFSNCQSLDLHKIFRDFRRKGASAPFFVAPTILWKASKIK